MWVNNINQNEKSYNHYNYRMGFLLFVYLVSNINVYNKTQNVIIWLFTFHIHIHIHTHIHNYCGYKYYMRHNIILYSVYKRTNRQDTYYYLSMVK